MYVKVSVLVLESDSLEANVSKQKNWIFWQGFLNLLDVVKGLTGIRRCSRLSIG